MVLKISALAVALIAVIASPSVAQRTRLDSIIKTTTLENGLEVVVMRNPSVPFATVAMVFRAGASIQASADDEGLPHLVEHMLFRRGDPDGGAFQTAANKIDAIWNGVTSAEAVRYYLTFPSKHLARGMQLMSDLVRKPKFSKDVLEVERRIVVGELEQKASDPMLVLMAEADLLLWDEVGWRSKDPGGSLAALEAATPDRLSALYKRYYVPNNAAIIVTGDVSEGDVFGLARQIFGGWKPGTDPIAGLSAPKIPPLTEVKRRVVGADVKDVAFIVRWQGPSVVKDRAATYAADVFAGLVNQPLSGTQRRLVDRGLFDAVSVRYETLNHVGPIELSARTSADRAVAAASALGEELAQLSAPGYFNDDDLALAKKRQQVTAQFRLESASTAVHLLAEFWSSAGLSYYMDYADQLEAQTNEDVRRFTRAYIAGKPMVVIAVIPPGAIASVAVPVRRALTSWGAQ